MSEPIPFTEAGVLKRHPDNPLLTRAGVPYPCSMLFNAGIDRRVLAQGKDAIDGHLNYVLPAMKKRGGYIPTCDHGVPAEVRRGNCRYCRQRCLLRLIRVERA